MLINCLKAAIADTFMMACVAISGIMHTEMTEEDAHYVAGADCLASTWVI